MGLFVKENGHFQGWLAALLCCGCAVDIDEHPTAWRPQYATQIGEIHYRQDQHMLAHAPPPYHSDREEATDFSSYHLPPHTQHLPLTTSPFDNLNFDFDLPTPEKETTPRLRARNSTSPFRRLESRESLRHSLVPLKLAPVVLRSQSHHETTLPNYSIEDIPIESNETLPEVPCPQESYRPPRESPFTRLQRQSFHELANRQSQLLSPSSGEDLQTSVALSAQSSAASLRRSTNDDASSSMTSRSSADLNTTRVRRKHSGTLARQNDEVEVVATHTDAIELNTIHEENKPDTPPRPSTAKSQSHIPAIAPSMQVQARSETLNDIGSAFTKPLELKDAKALEELLSEPDERRPRSSSQGAGLRSRSSSRVSGWLNSVRTSSASSVAQTHNTETSFGSLRNAMPGHTRGLSKVSRSSSVTMFDSEPGTVASSPVASRGPRSGVLVEATVTALAVKGAVDGLPSQESCQCYHPRPETVGMAF